MGTIDQAPLLHRSGWSRLLMYMPLIVGSGILIVGAYTGYRKWHQAAATAVISETTAGVPVPASPLSSIRTVFVILEENHNWAEIESSTTAPFLRDTLLRMGAHAKQYFNPPGLHPSEPNYIWLEAGSNLGIVDNSDPVFNHRSTTDHLVSYLSRAGISWKAYAEDIDGAGCPLSNVGKYAVRHVPFLFFDDVTQGNDPGSPECIAHIRPYSELDADMANNRVARYNFIKPNLNHDMHDGTIADADAWLSRELPKIFASRAYQNGGAVFITWDEGEGGQDGPIGMIVLSPYAKAGYSNSIQYNHSSTVRTLQEIFGVSPLLGSSASSTDLSDLFDPAALSAVSVYEDGVVNNASYASAGVAPGSIVAVFGANLTDSTPCVAPSCYPTIGPDGSLNKTLSGTQVLINGSPVPLFYTSPGQVGIQLPFDLTGTSATVQVISGNRRSASRTISVATVSPGIFTWRQDGSGAGAITHADGTAVLGSSPAQRGELLILYGTGFGSVTPAVATGTIAAGPAATISPLAVLIDGVRVLPDYAGLSGCCVGLNQVNFHLPAGTRSGAEIPIAVEIGGVRSNNVTVPVR